jgi:hypothetical protein
MFMFFTPPHKNPKQPRKIFLKNLSLSTMKTSDIKRAKLKLLPADGTTFCSKCCKPSEDDGTCQKLIRNKHERCVLFENKYNSCISKHV